MRRNLFLYLFIFASLIALILYVNGRNYQESIENDVISLRAKTVEQDALLDSIADSQLNQPISFTLEQHQEAKNYFEKLGWTSERVQQNVTDQLLDLNLESGGNPLVPFTGQGRGFQINDTRFINHKWVLVNFSDNNQWGELLVTYTIQDEDTITLETTASVLNDRYR
ncbi:hypothetical protein SAMN05192588_1195 [Nonlabens sp. Hel1_33_55]|uniref:hypothetical protein n=1 Tax=Nonlabens sp. Hel1_33_55 TaxID=1336802 RepID=UPI000875E480|nr:hypothetical protein [Nonlabens sp. Hel1_33_55]SCY11002.1 hypothetical protein SAMN05192588_1195 [Nonlabens sp. Hel1_33_55]